MCTNPRNNDNQNDIVLLSIVKHSNQLIEILYSLNGQTYKASVGLRKLEFKTENSVGISIPDEFILAIKHNGPVLEKLHLTIRDYLKEVNIDFPVTLGSLTDVYPS